MRHAAGVSHLRIATWNVWFRFGDWRTRQAAIASVLAEVDADVVCLQESWVEVQGRSQPAELADALGLPEHRFVSRFPDRGVWIGNAILSRWPITRTGSWAFPTRSGLGHFLTALAVDLDTDAGRWRVATAHLNHRRSRSLGRLAEARALRDLALAGSSGARDGRPDPTGSSGARDGRPDPADADGTPVVVAGDLNADPGSPEVTVLTGASRHGFLDAWETAGDGGEGLTWDARNPHTARSKFPDRRLDYLLVRPDGDRGTPRVARLFGCDTVDGPPASDHYGLVADLNDRRS